MSQQCSNPQAILKTLHRQLNKFQPKNDMQEEAFDAWDDEMHLVLDGPAGVGKTFLAILFAVTNIADEIGQDTIHIIRSAVPVRNQGYLPGKIEEKEEEYKAPYIPLFEKIVGRYGAWNIFTNGRNPHVRFTTTSYLRGTEFNDSVVIIEEAQNMTEEELHTIMTRIGYNTSVIVCGDIEQTDLKGREQTGYGNMRDVWKAMDNFEFIQFDERHIERSEFLKAYYSARRDVKKTKQEIPKILAA